MLPVWLTDTVTSDLDRALHYTALWGLEGVELRTVGGPNVRVPHVNERKLLRRLEEGEFALAAVGPGLFEGPLSDRGARLNEVAALQETAQFCVRAGCRLVVASSFTGTADVTTAADLLRRAGDVAARYGATFALLNEHDGAFPTGTALAELLAAADHPAVGAAWSPAEALRAGEDPAVGLAALAGRVRLVRVRDGRGADEAWTEAEVGEGAVGWNGQLATLVAQGFDGPLSLEVTVEPKPKTGLKAATALIHGIRAARRARTT